MLKKNKDLKKQCKEHKISGKTKGKCVAQVEKNMKSNVEDEVKLLNCAEPSEISRRDTELLKT